MTSMQPLSFLLRRNFTCVIQLFIELAYTCYCRCLFQRTLAIAKLCLRIYMVIVVSIYVCVFCGICERPLCRVVFVIAKSLCLSLQNLHGFNPIRVSECIFNHGKTLSLQHGESDIRTAKAAFAA